MLLRKYRPALWAVHCFSGKPSEAHFTHQTSFRACLGFQLASTGSSRTIGRLSAGPILHNWKVLWRLWKSTFSFCCWAHIYFNIMKFFFCALTDVLLKRSTSAQVYPLCGCACVRWVCLSGLLFPRVVIALWGGGREGRPSTQCSPFWEISVRKRNYRIRWEGLDSFSSVVYILTFYIIYRSQCETLINAAVCETGNN